MVSRIISSHIISLDKFNTHGNASCWSQTLNPSSNPSDRHILDSADHNSMALHGLLWLVIVYIRPVKYVEYSETGIILKSHIHNFFQMQHPFSCSSWIHSFALHQFFNLTSASMPLTLLHSSDLFFNFYFMIFREREKGRERDRDRDRPTTLA